MTECYVFYNPSGLLTPVYALTYYLCLLTWTCFYRAACNAHAV